MKYVVIGAGPAGLTAGLLLAKKKAPVTIFEAHSQVGGIAKTIRYKKYRFDIGGHRFFAKYPIINQFWRHTLGKNLMLVKRSSKIFYQKKFYHYPLEPANALSNLGLWQSFLAFFSYLKVRISPVRPEATLEDVYVNSFGRFLYRKFFQIYSTRLWGLSPALMAPDWGKQRVGKLSLSAAIRDAFLPQTTKVKSLIKTFHYPKLGPGQMWEAVARQITRHHGRIYTHATVEKIFHYHHRLTKIQVKIRHRTRTFPVDHVISTMPIQDLITSLSPPAPSAVLQVAAKLVYRDFILVALIINRKHIFPDQWIYIQDPGFAAVRIQNINNWSRFMVASPRHTVLGVEYVTSQTEPLWQLSDQALIDLAKTEVAKLGFATLPQIVDAKVVRELKVYPVYNHGYQKHLQVAKNYLAQFRGLSTIGRNGMHRYNNMDHSMLTAMFAVDNLFGAKHDIWQVNADTEYLETVKP